MNKKELNKEQTQEIRRILALVQSNDDFSTNQALNNLKTFQNLHPNVPLDFFMYEASGDTILHLAARQNDEETTKYLLKYFSPNCRNKDNKTPLHEAAQFGHFEASNILIRAGADVNALKKADWTPLMLACTKLNHQKHDKLNKQQNHALINLLLEHGALVNFQNKDGWSTIHLASREGDVKLINILTNHGANLQQKTRNGNTCLHIAALHGHSELFQLLKTLIKCNNSSLLVQNNQGNYPVHEAVLSKSLEMLQSVVNSYKSANIDILKLINKSGYNILHLSAFIGAEKSVHLCLDEGFDVNCVTNDGLSVLHLAARNNMHNIYDICVKNGADAFLTDKFQRTPADYFKFQQ